MYRGKEKEVYENGILGFFEKYHIKGGEIMKLTYKEKQAAKTIIDELRKSNLIKFNLIANFFFPLTVYAETNFDTNIQNFSAKLSEGMNFAWAGLVIVEGIALLTCAAVIINSAMQMAKADSPGARAEAKSHLLAAVVSLAIVGALPLIAYTLLVILSV